MSCICGHVGFYHDSGGRCGVERCPCFKFRIATEPEREFDRECRDIVRL
jgi:hypothetical protein